MSACTSDTSLNMVTFVVGTCAFMSNCKINSIHNKGTVKSWWEDVYARPAVLRNSFAAGCQLLLTMLKDKVLRHTIACLVTHATLIALAYKDTHANGRICLPAVACASILIKPVVDSVPRRISILAPLQMSCTVLVVGTTCRCISQL